MDKEPQVHFTVQHLKVPLQHTENLCLLIDNRKITVISTCGEISALLTASHSHLFSISAQPVPVQSSEAVSPSSDPLSACDAKSLVSGQSLGGDSLVHSVLAGVDVQRGHGVIMLEGGHQMELKTVAVETWHVQEFDDSEIPLESTGQLHEEDSYVIRWTYTINTVGQ